MAESKTNEVLGYLLYRRVSKGVGLPIAVIVHLCVAGNSRLRGVSRALVENLFSRTESNFLRVEVKCRKDYHADRVWPRLGFTYVDEEPGRAGVPLVRWHKNFRQPPLLHLLNQQQKTKKFRVVADANVFYRFQDPIPSASNHQRRLAEEAKALNEEWISEDVQVLITDETLNEIHRHPNPAERRRRLTFARQYERPISDAEKEKEVRRRLQVLFPPRVDDNPVSDIKQLSQTIAGSVDCFVTQDRPLLKRAQALRVEFGLNVLSPGEFACKVDEIVREIQYRPASLAGVHRLNRSRIQSTEMAELHLDFLGPDERRGEFDSRIRTFMAQRDRYKCEIWRDSEGKKLALIALEVVKGMEMIAHLLRVRRSPLANTVARYLLRHLVVNSAGDDCLVTRIIDSHFSSSIVEAGEEFGFTQMEGQWIKLNLPFVGDSQQLLHNFSCFHKKFDKGHPAAELADRLVSAMKVRGPDCLVDFEKRLWPAKIIDAPLQNYLVPIWPSWAQHLFDSAIATETLWGAREDLALRHENVYYRRKGMSKGIVGPARILWYVTDQKDYKHCKQVRACSFLDEVAVGPAKNLFDRFKRLGIYEWKQILETADNKPRGHIMALRFSNTEGLSKPIGYHTLLKVLMEESGKKPVLQSPQPISAQSFERLYSYGRGLGEAV